MRILQVPCSALVGKNAIEAIMADLNSSLTAMDWLPKLSGSYWAIDQNPQEDPAHSRQNRKRRSSDSRV
ncbi:hypothetical protein P5673_019950 [Acropora cervicornis]|uniref:Uncharacterized protein n=1 Tax=Acropora cervicornis TaxID=6130 RepID=A0AAD9V1C0_ACRCE|nr:hypothetical protein P5673_019950 [Acropora cervicornis]